MSMRSPFRASLRHCDHSRQHDRVHRHVRHAIAAENQPRRESSATVLSGTLKQFACSVAITPDGTTLIVGTCGTANLQAIDLTTGSYGQTTFASINVEIDSASLAITPDGSTIFVCDHGAPKIHMVV